MTSAERKRKQRAKALANMTEEEKRNSKEKENKTQSQLRKLQIAKMSKECSDFCAKEVAWVTASRKGKKQAKPDPPLQVKIPPPRTHKNNNKALENH